MMKIDSREIVAAWYLPGCRNYHTGG